MGEIEATAGFSIRPKRRDSSGGEAPLAAARTGGETRENGRGAAPLPGDPRLTPTEAGDSFVGKALGRFALAERRKPGPEGAPFAFGSKQVRRGVV